MQTIFVALSSKGQMKIQEMAFALVVVMIFIFLAGFFFINVILSSLKDDVAAKTNEKAVQMAAQLASYPEFSWSSNLNRCENCMDFDKLLAFKESLRNSKSPYNNFFGKDVVAIKVDVLFPVPPQVECSLSNYPKCSTVTIMNKSSSLTFQGSYVSLCRPDSQTGKSRNCMLGLISIALNKTT